MNLASFFIRRPIATVLMMSALLLFGIVAYRTLPVSDLPNVDFPTIQVRSSLRGASADTMAASVAQRRTHFRAIHIRTRDPGRARWGTFVL